VQDFTPIMMSILQLMVSNGTPLMCIGDEDQGIYNFRGADIYNTLDFSNKFPGGEVYSLTRNRRCRKEILDFAKGVIEENKIRYNKIIEGVKDGGSVEMIPYSSIESEHLKIVSMIRNLSEADLNNSVICYRDRYSSIMLAEMLAEANIPFNIISGFEAYSHILYKDLIEIFNALESPFDKALSISLYKVLPVKKDKMFSVFGYDPALRRFRTDDKKHFASYDYGDAMAINGFADNLEVLNRLSVEIQDGTMDRVFPTIFQMLKKYHWNYLRRDREKIAIYDDFIEDRVDKVFNQHRTYKAIFEQLSQKMERCRRNNRNKEGITLATFHGLKGLEFKNCYLMDLDNGRFPNFSLIDSKPYKEEVKEALKECETRLFYVAATRAKDNLIMFYYEDNPSRYLLKYLKGNQLIESNEDVQPKELLVTVQEEDNEIEDDSLLELLDDYDDSASSNTDPITGTDAEDDLLELLTEFDDVKVKQEPTVLQNVDVNNVNVSSTSSSSSYIGKVIGNLSKAGVFGGK
jgi:DNA helicase-2/ATP-dependent DNA helicase PcrA